MKLHASRYGLTAGLGSLTSSSVMIASNNEATQWVIAALMAAFIGILCTMIVPYDAQGDK